MSSKSTTKLSASFTPAQQFKSSALKALYAAAADCKEPTKTPHLKLDDLFKFQALQCALNFVKGPNFLTFRRVLQVAHSLMSFSHKSKIADLHRYHPQLLPAHVKIVRSSRMDTSSLDLWPSPLDFLREYCPLHILLSKFGNTLEGLVFTPSKLSIFEKQELWMYIFLLTNFQRVLAKSVYAAAFEECDFDLYLRTRAPRRTPSNLTNVVQSVRTLYNDCARAYKDTNNKTWPYGPQRLSVRGPFAESTYRSALRLVEILAAGKVGLAHIVQLQRLTVSKNKVSVETATKKMRHLDILLQDILPTMDTTIIKSFLDTARTDFSKRASTPQSASIPGTIVEYYATAMDASISSKKQIDGANARLLCAVGTRVGNITATRSESVATTRQCVFTIGINNSKSVRPHKGPQKIDLPIYADDHSPDRAFQKIVKILGGEPPLMFGYLKEGTEACVENYIPHTSNSLKRLYKEMIEFSPSHLRTSVEIDKVTGNAARFTAQRIRMEAGLKPELRDAMAQHVTKEIRTIYEASDNDLKIAGDLLQQYWNGIRRTLKFHDDLLADFPQTRKRPTLSFSKNSKRTKLDLKRSPPRTPSSRKKRRRLYFYFQICIFSKFVLSEKAEEKEKASK